MSLPKIAHYIENPRKFTKLISPVSILNLRRNGFVDKSTVFSWVSSVCPLVIWSSVQIPHMKITDLSCLLALRAPLNSTTTPNTWKQNRSKPFFFFFHQNLDKKKLVLVSAHHLTKIRKNHPAQKLELFSTRQIHRSPSWHMQDEWQTYPFVIWYFLI